MQDEISSNPRRLCVFVSTFAIADGVFDRSGNGSLLPLSQRTVDGRLTSCVPLTPAIANAITARPHRLESVDAADDVGVEQSLLPLSADSKNDAPISQIEQVLRCAPFVFPSGISVYDPRRPKLANETKAQDTSSLCLFDDFYVSPHDPRETDVEHPSQLHTFTLTDEKANCYYGHVLTRWHRITKPERVAVMRMQIAARSMLMSSNARAKNARRDMDDSGSLSFSNDDPEQVVDVEDSRDNLTGEEPDLTQEMLEPANESWEPTAILILTSEPLIETMRAVLFSLNSHVRTGDKFTSSHAAVVYRTLGGCLSIPVGPSWPHSSLSNDDNESNTNKSEDLSKMLPSGVLLPDWDEELPWQSVFYDQLTGISLSWCTSCNPNNEKCPAHPCIKKAVVPPWGSPSWEIPQKPWECQTCHNRFIGITREAIRDVTENMSALPASKRQLWKGRLRNHIRSVESRSCVSCVAQLPLSTTESEGGDFEDASLLACVPGLSLSQPAADFLSKTVHDSSKSLKGSGASVPIPFAFPASCKPIAYDEAEASSFETLHVDPRQLFAHVQPRNIIAIVTALLCERNVLVVCSDRSILPDIMTTLLALLLPFKWCGAYIPVLPSSMELSDLLNAPLPVFAGALPEDVRRSPPVYVPGYGNADRVALPKDMTERISKAYRLGDSSGGTKFGLGEREAPVPSPNALHNSVPIFWRPVGPAHWLQYSHILGPRTMQIVESMRMKEAEKRSTEHGSEFGDVLDGIDSDDDDLDDTFVVDVDNTADIEGKYSSGAALVGLASASSLRRKYHSTHAQTVSNVMTCDGSAVVATSSSSNTIRNSTSQNRINLLLQGTWEATWDITMGLGVPLPPEQTISPSAPGDNDKGRPATSSSSKPPRTSRAKRRGGRGEVITGKGGKRPLSMFALSDRAAQCSVVVLDVDADAVSPNYVPPTHLLPARLSMRLWRAITKYAGIWAYSKNGAPLPPPLPHFPSGTHASEVGAAVACSEEFAEKSVKKGWCTEMQMKSLFDEADGGVTSSNIETAPSAFVNTDALNSQCVLERIGPVLRVSMNKASKTNTSRRNFSVESILEECGPSQYSREPLLLLLKNNTNGDPKDTPGSLFSSWSNFLAGSQFFLRNLYLGASLSSDSNSQTLSAQPPLPPMFGKSSSSFRGISLKKQASVHASLRAFDYLNSDEDEDDGIDDDDAKISIRATRWLGIHSADSPSLLVDPLDCAPIQLVDPWNAWRMQLNGSTRMERTIRMRQTAPAEVKKSKDVTGGADMTGSSSAGQSQTASFEATVLEPSLCFSRVRLAFMSVLVSLFKSSKLYAHATLLRSQEERIATAAAATANVSSMKEAETLISSTISKTTVTNLNRNDDVPDSSTLAGSEQDIRVVKIDSAASFGHLDLDNNETEPQELSLSNDNKFEGAEQFRGIDDVTNDDDELQNIEHVVDDVADDEFEEEEDGTIDGALADDQDKMRPSPTLSQQERITRQDSASSVASSLDHSIDSIGKDVKLSSPNGIPPQKDDSDSGADNYSSTSPTFPSKSLYELLSLVAQPFVRSVGLSSEVHSRPHGLRPNSIQGPPVVSNQSAAFQTITSQNSDNTLAEIPQASAKSKSLEEILRPILQRPVQTHASVRIDFDKLAYLALETGGGSIGGTAEPLVTHIVMATELFEMFIQERVRCELMARRLLYAGKVDVEDEELSRDRRSTSSFAGDSAAASSRSMAGALLGTHFNIELQEPQQEGCIQEYIPKYIPDSLPDLFDRACFKRVLLRSWRHTQLRGRPFAGRLWKAMRGTLSRAWSLRYFEMGRSNILAYYSSGDAIEGAEKRLSSLKTQLSGLTAPKLNPPSSISEAVIAADAVEPKSEYMILAESIQREEQALSELRSVNFKGSFHIIPGRTILKIPSSVSTLNKPSTSIGNVLSSLSNGVAMGGSTGSGSGTNTSGFPTRFVFQIINPAKSRHSSMSESSGSNVESQTDFAGNTFDFLTLCADSAPRRREWLLRLRANSQVPLSQLGSRGGSMNSAPKLRDEGDSTSSSSQIDNSLQIIYLGTLPQQGTGSDSTDLPGNDALEESSSSLTLSRGTGGDSTEKISDIHGVSLSPPLITATSRARRASSSSPKTLSFSHDGQAIPTQDLASSHRAAITKALRQRLETWDEKSRALDMS
jgi:hypothetical protein